jgi:hypothetical protein
VYPAQQLLAMAEEKKDLTIVALSDMGITGDPNVPHDCRYIKASTDWTQTESGIAGDTRSTSNIAKGW